MTHSNDAVKKEFDGFITKAQTSQTHDEASYIKENFNSLSAPAQNMLGENLSNFVEYYITDLGQGIDKMKNDQTTLIMIKMVGGNVDTNNTFEFLKAIESLGRSMGFADEQMEQDIQDDINQAHQILKLADVIQEIKGPETRESIKSLLTKVSMATDAEYNDCFWLNTAVYDTYKSTDIASAKKPSTSPEAPKKNPLANKKYKF